MGDTNRDPSMEEILASIKRVIAEEAPPPPQRAPRAARPQPEEEDVLELSNPVSAGPALLSEGAAEASRTRLASLAEMRRQGESSAPAGDGPMEAMVREMLKPMLKDWLDAHLPEIVEELVTREIARITTGKDI
jgi:cell pole-organizing protein PopZ